MPKGRITNHMSRPIFKYLWFWLIEGHFSHMLEWSDRQKWQFSVLFMNKRNKSFEEKYLALFKAMENIFPTKAEKYKKRPDHDKECKKRCHSNLQKLCHDGVLKYLGKTKIKGNESPIKFYYEFMKVPDDFIKEKYIKDSKFGNKVIEKDIRSETFHYSCLSNTELIYTNLINSYNTSNNNQSGSDVSLCGSTNDVDHQTHNPILLPPHQSGTTDVSFYESTTDEILLESKIPHIITSQNIALEHAINNSALFLGNTDNENLPQSEISLDLNALLNTTRNKSLEYVTPLQDNVDIISTYEQTFIGKTNDTSTLESGTYDCPMRYNNTPANKRRGTYDALTSQPSKRQRVEALHSSSRSRVPGSSPEPSPPSSPHSSASSSPDNRRTPTRPPFRRLRIKTPNPSSPSDEYSSPSSSSSPTNSSILLDSIISHSSTSQNIDLEHAINNGALFLGNTHNENLPQSEMSLDLNALLNTTRNKSLEYVTPLQDNVEIISTYEQTFIGKTNDTSMLESGTYDCPMQYNNILLDSIISHTSTSQIIDREHEKSKQVFISDKNSENEGCLKKENESSQQEVSVLEKNSQSVLNKEEIGNVIQMDEDMPLSTEHYDTVESDELLRSFLPAVY